MIKKIVIVSLSIGVCSGALNKEQQDKGRRWAHKTVENITKSLGETTRQAISHVKKTSRVKTVTPQDRFYLDLYAGKRVAVPSGGTQ